MSTQLNPWKKPDDEQVRQVTAWLKKDTDDKFSYFVAGALVGSASTLCAVVAVQFLMWWRGS